MSALLPALSCAFCPACVSLWKPLFALFGVAVLTTETQHTWLLAFALILSLGAALREAVRLGEWRPFIPTLLGSMLLVAGHTLESHAAEWLGTAVMFLSMPLRMRLRLERSAT